MLYLDPELINIEDRGGYLRPTHYANQFGVTEAIELLLKYIPDAASKEVNDGSRLLPPLHHSYTNINSIQVLYDAYPDAVFARDDEGYLSILHA